jgi:hypothetical protein
LANHLSDQYIGDLLIWVDEYTVKKIDVIPGLFLIKSSWDWEKSMLRRELYKIFGSIQRRDFSCLERGKVSLLWKVIFSWLWEVMFP